MNSLELGIALGAVVAGAFALHRLARRSPRREVPGPPHPHPPHPLHPSIGMIDPHALDGALKRRHFQLDERSHWQRGDVHISVEIGESGLRVGVWLHLSRRAEIDADATLAQTSAVESLRDGTLEVRPGTRPVQLHFTAAAGDEDTLDRALAVVDALSAHVRFL